MKPIASNINIETCDPISSNCVDWEGGDLPCIKVCKGDRISDIVHKACVVLQELKDDLDLSDMDLSYIFGLCQSCPEPDRSLQNVLAAIIAKMKSNAENGGGTIDPLEKTLVIASCFQTRNDDGDLVTSLLHSDYTKKIGLQVCSILLELASQSTELDNHEIRIAALENVDPIDPVSEVNVVCVAPGSSTTNPVVKRIDVAFELLEPKFCELQSIMGSSSDLNAAIGDETQPSGSPSGIFALTDPSRTLWSIAASNIGELLQHSWLALNDLRAAVKTMQDSCCKITCEDIKVDFDIKLSDDRTLATLFFITKSTLPTGFVDCNSSLGNKLTITDALGNTYDTYVKVAQEVTNPDGLVIDLSGTPINPSQDYYFNMDACLSNDSFTCVKCVNKTATYKDTCSYCEITVVGKGAADGKIVVITQDPITGVKSGQSIYVGQTQVIKKSSTIISIINYGNVIYTSTCNNLPIAESALCYIMQWTQGAAKSGGDEALENGIVESLSILGIDYVVNLSTGDLSGLQTRLRAICDQSQVVNYVDIVDPTGATNHYDKRFIFQAVPSIIDVIKMHLNGTGMPGDKGGYYLFPFASEDDCS